MVFTHYVPPPLGIVKPSRSEIKYSLSRFRITTAIALGNSHVSLISAVVQNPEKARCCGFGEKDRRVIDPPPIVELKATLHGQHLSLNSADTKLFSVQCDLFSSDTRHRCSLVYPPPYYSAQEGVMIKSPPLRNLLGSVVSNAYVLYNLENERGVYFVFSDLSVRTEGEFTLQFRFNDLDAGYVLAN